MKEKLLDVGLKILVVTCFISLLILFLSFVEKSEKKKELMYRVDFYDHRVWTKNVTPLDNGGISFVDENSGREFSVYGSYAIIKPKK